MNPPGKVAKKKKAGRMPPLDMAVVKQKVFQQFDFIIDADREIQRKMQGKS